MARELTGPARTRRFEEFRLSIIKNAKPVSAEARAQWWERFQQTTKSLFEPRKLQFRKPGLPTEMFKARVFLDRDDSLKWEEFFARLDSEWRRLFAGTASEMHTYAGFDGGRMIFEFALLDQGAYLTGSLTIDRWEEPKSFQELEEERGPETRRTSSRR